MPVVTSLYAALFALLLVVLAVAVVRVRLRDRVGIGHGGNDRLALRAGDDVVPPDADGRSGPEAEIAYKKFTLKF